MIGFYDYTVILTYISFISAVAGIFCASSRQLQWAIFFLAFSGFCDMFDGKIARTKKNRTEDEESFGIQIDSLCDIVCFGVLPIVICYKLGMDHIYGMAILALYGLSEETTRLARTLIFIHNGCACALWPLSFTFPNMLRACNDVRYTMVVSIVSMFLFRIGFSYLIGVRLGYGAIGVWIAMVLDWICRVICFLLRYAGGKWRRLAGLDLQLTE